MGLFFCLQDVGYRKHGMRKIYIIGPINDEAYLAFSKKIDALQQENSDPIDVELVSEGGYATAGMAFYGKIRNSPCKIIITTYGVCQSAATLILAAGDIRRASAETSIMVHDSKITIKGIADDLLEKAYKEANAELAWATLFQERTNIPAGTWRQLSKKETYLTAKQALQYGLIDEIIKGKKK